MNTPVYAQHLFRVAVVDDNAVFRRAVHLHLSRRRPWQILAHVSDGAHTVEVIRKNAPDVVLLDVHLPGMDGFEIAKRVLTLPDPPAIVFLTLQDETAYRDRAQAMGAAGLVVKDQMFGQLIPLLDRLAHMRRSQ